MDPPPKPGKYTVDKVENLPESRKIGVGRLPVMKLASKINRLLVLAAAGTLFAAPALADPPPWAGHGKGDEQGEGRGHGGPGKGGRVRFDDRHRVVVREYYTERFHAGFCPPGLAKKNNGCLPPGQAKKWAVGYPLPRDVVFYDLPPPLIVRLGPPPANSRYVRVGADILLIAVGTGIILDAIEDLGGM